ncbi:prepilin-type N-terminal cleavage/methylation domain-containing protein [Pseudidiomarina sp.]|uniref:prepilin-type N-terminal cleavage/methylation domain-containing protein n=1 Tax=Pseudidiomarina sp. TaxID=2081707 RepID=UPI00299E3BB3|nr:prepilin-type N-terminal cleavage/methylation domain-containing protein [Pseudidiomarina sp.]MDX1706301.1 prepilin-type N-terminal cleavage/methylation domain-containing protein [Pseudidiomarina sp.]
MNGIRGFTIIEIVIGIVVLAIALVGLSATLFPQASRSVDPVYQVRATELGQSLLIEMISLSFDQANNQAGGNNRCSASPPRVCTDPANLGPDSGESREDYNDVDDFNGFSTSGDLLTGATISELYKNFIVSVAVCYASSINGSCVNSITDYKKVTTVVTTPNELEITFSAYRGNL